MTNTYDLTGKVALVTADKHHNDRLATLDVVHAPTGAKVFAHLEHTFANRPHISQVAQLGLRSRLLRRCRVCPSFRSLSQSENSPSSFTVCRNRTITDDQAPSPCRGGPMNGLWVCVRAMRDSLAD